MGANRTDPPRIQHKPITRAHRKPLCPEELSEISEELENAEGRSHIVHETTAFGTDDRLVYVRPGCTLRSLVPQIFDGRALETK